MHCVVITVVQLFNIFLFLVDKVNYLYYRSCYVEVLQRSFADKKNMVKMLSLL